MIGRTLRWGLRLGLAVLLVTLAAVIWADRATLSETLDGAALSAPVDAAIVLGAGVSGDGRLHYSSRRRVEGAVALLASGKAERLIFSGGIGGNHPTVSAAQLMRDFAEELGADPQRLLIEPRAVSTFENIRFSFEIAAARGLDSLALVSDPYHLPRARRIAAWFGRPEIPVSAVAGFDTTWWPERGLHYTREALAWWLNLGKIAGWEGLALLGVSPEARAEMIR
ncbi:YdcF family protein [Paralimibaculum aggregatum]|nr:YdcF family protein [Limibaculum sp. NKW23]